MDAGHLLASGRIVKQIGNFAHNPLLVGANEPNRPGFHRLGPLGLFPHDEHRLTQRRPFLLNAAGIGEKNSRPTHEVRKWHVIKRFDQMNVQNSGKPPLNRILHVWIPMNGIYDLNIRPCRNRSQRPADTLKALAETLASMSGDNDEFLRWIEKAPVARRQLARIETPGDIQNCVNPRISGDMDRALRNSFRKQIAFRALSVGAK